MSRDIPIIFSAPMVRALLDGRKTMTRRILKAPMPAAPGMDNVHPKNTARHPAPYFDAYCGERKTGANPRGMSRNWCWWTRDDRQCLPTINVKYQPGDRLWVRESLQRFEREPATAQYIADITGVPAPAGVDRHPNGAALWQWKQKSIPSIHMPRWASRLTLIVTGVKVERLQDIPLSDVKAEGCEVRQFWLFGADGPERQKIGARVFGNLWEEIHGRESWDQNPFVVAISFRVIKANIDAEAARVAA